MPILDVELVGVVPSVVRENLAARIADEAGAVLQSRPQGTWVRVRGLDESLYAENGGGPDPGVRPVFVSVLKAHVGDSDALAVEAAALAEAVGRACDRPADNVHVIYEPPAAGRIAFGGKLVRP